jgi:hypothetical protein
MVTCFLDGLPAGMKISKKKRKEKPKAKGLFWQSSGVASLLTFTVADPTPTSGYP